MSEEQAETMEQEVAPEVKPTSINDLKPKMKVKGTVSRLELYGAFIDLGIGPSALIHISQLGKEHVNRVADVLNVGDEVSVWVDKVDPQREQIMVTMVAPLDVEWGELETPRRWQNGPGRPGGRPPGKRASRVGSWPGPSGTNCQNRWAKFG